MSDSTVLVGLSQSYIEALTLELKSAEDCYNEYSKAAQKAKEEYDLSVQWEDCLKSYLTRLGTTYGMVSSIDAYIDTMVVQATNVCNTITLAKDATNILLICVRCLSEQNEKLKQSIKDLLEIISCLNEPVLDPNVSIMKCLDDLRIKVDEGLVAVLAAIKELLNLMKCVLELEHKICATETNPKGLIDDLNRLISILTCNYPHGSAQSDVNCDELNPAYATPPLGELNCPTCLNDCGEETIATPVTLECDYATLKPELCKDCGNSYHQKLIHDYNRASQQTCYAKCVWDYFKDLEQKAKSNRDSTKAALDAATAAKAKCN